MKQKIRIAVVLLMAVFSTTTLTAQEYQLVWSDEFNYEGLPDTERWGYDVGGHGWGNQELQYYTENRQENARVENGKLIIEARKETYQNNQYTSARLVTRNKGDWLYGRIEVKAKLPSGKGTWPAIWMLPTDWSYGGWPDSGEIDIMEHVGYDATTIFGTVHTEAFNHSIGTQKGGEITVNDCETAYHVYAIEWTEDKIDFYVDDSKYYSFSNLGGYEKWPFDKRFHLILNIAVGGTWGGAQGVDPSVFPQKMYIDYVRVYQPSDNVKITGEDYVIPQSGGNTFSAPSISNYDYQWSVPADAVIEAGQGTHSIKVQWGQTDGEIVVDMTSNTNSYHLSHTVKYVDVPESNEYVLYDYNTDATNGWQQNSNSDNTFTFSTTNNYLKIDYNTVSTSDWGHAIYTFSRPVSLKDVQAIQIFLAQDSENSPTNFRLDLFDVYGVETNGGDLFKRNELYKDGDFYEYGHNFIDDWVSNSPNYGESVDEEKIAGFKIYLNYGVFGRKNISGSVFLTTVKAVAPDLLSVENRRTNTAVEVYPNPMKNTLSVSALCKIYRVSVFDLSGKNLMNLPFNANNISLSLNGLEQGIYLIEINTRKGHTVHKIIKQ